VQANAALLSSAGSVFPGDGDVSVQYMLQNFVYGEETQEPGELLLHCDQEQYLSPAEKQERLEQEAYFFRFKR